MSDKITWWPAALAKDILEITIVLMRSDWPDPDQRIYQIGLYDPGKMHPWTDGRGGILETPDYFVVADQIVEFIEIPADREYTYGKKS